MFEIKTDIAANIIYLYFFGKFDASQGKALVDKFTESLRKIKPGFRLLSDLSHLEIMDVEAHKSIDIVMDLSNKHKVSRVVRVLTNKELDIGFNIMSLFHYSKNVEIQTFDSIDAAKMFLKDNACREGLNGVT